MNKAHAKELLKKFDFKALFLDELGWDNHEGLRTLNVGDEKFQLNAVAEKRGMAAFVCQIPDKPIDYPTRGQIEAQLAKSIREHIIIYVDRNKRFQTWQWVKREPGRPIARREHTYAVNQSGEALVQKLEALEVKIEEEEQLTLVGIAGRVQAAFDIERITKAFYREFDVHRKAFTGFIDGISEVADRQWYASVMLNRLMFIYFIQRKGFLDGDTHYLRNRLQRCQQAKGKDKFYSFYRYFLLRLFHEGFGKRRKERSPDLEKLIGNIPYLNGGLFDVHELEKPERYGRSIQIPDKAFERIFAYFDRYQWHLDERPLRADNEINPDVLGYIFEKYINQKQMGAYYTKEDITEYISKNSVIPFLFDAARAKCKVAFDNPNGPTVWDLLRKDPDRYIYDAMKKGVDLPLPKNIVAGLDTKKPNLLERRKDWNKPAAEEFALPTETWREVVARRQRCEEIRKKLAAGEVREINDFITLNLDLRQFAQDVIQNCEGPDLLMAFWQAITTITILDPTGGSGAFIFAALNVLDPLYEACLDRMEAFLAEWSDAGKKLHPNYHKKFTEILARVDAHPNRRYFVLKSIILNNLYAVDIMEEAVEICKLRLFLKLAALVDPDPSRDNLGIEPLPDIDFNIRAGNTLVGFATENQVEAVLKNDLLAYQTVWPEVQREAQEISEQFHLFRQQQTEIGGAVTAKDKARLSQKLAPLEDRLNAYLAETYGKTKKTEVKGWVESHRPFHWFLVFYEIMSKGGFDVIIGNPPYVEYKEVRKYYRIQNYATEECGNLYAFVYERAITLLSAQGKIGFIIPVAAVSTEGYSSLRHLWLATGNLIISNFNDRPGKLFDGLEHIRLSIVLYAKTKLPSRSVFTTTYLKWLSNARPQLFHTLTYINVTALLRGNEIPKLGSLAESAILMKSQAQRRTVGYYSAQSGSNCIFYTRKLSHFVQVLDYVPIILDSKGRQRPPTELKQVSIISADKKNALLCALNSTLFYWLLSVWSDCRNLNKREVYGLPFDLDRAKQTVISFLNKLGKRLMDDFNKKSKMVSMQYKDWGKMTIQCIYPRNSKPIIDEIDTVLADHYGFTAEELDFIINYDIKYRMGQTEENGDE